jgi:ABC-type multidrug transport system ATPase subunit/ABC-type multidrug transport system permease subunit
LYLIHFPSTSTLLDVLADRKLVGQWAGEIYFNHGPRSKFFNRDSAYILQDDLHYATLTVRETIYYACCFKLPEGSKETEIEERVDELLKMMGLSHIQESLVGDQTRKGISGGQAKRLSIAVEIAALPDLIFLDEPTSGLDSTMALEVMSVVRRLADQNRTCIATIHQPSPEVFDLFDKVILLCAGKLVYNGPSKAVVEYFTGPGLNYFFDEGQNPAEFIIDVGEGIIKPRNALEPLTIEELHQQYLNSRFRHISPSEDLLAKAKQSHDEFVSQSSGQRRHATTSWTQFRILTRRNLLAIRRDIPEISAQLAKNITVGFLIGLIFYQQASTSTPLFNEYGIPEPEVQTINSLLFFGIMYTMLSNIHSIPYLCSRNLLFRREVASYAYSVAPNWASHVLTVIPLQIVVFTFWIIFVYFLCGFPNSGDYFWYFYLVLFLACMNSYYFAMLLAAAIGNVRLALTIFPLFFLFLATFVGFAIPVDDVPVIWGWACQIDYVRWSWEGLMTNQWGSYSADDDYFGGSQSVLSMYDMQFFNKYYTFWISGLATLLMVILVYIAMRPPRRSLEKLPLDTMRLVSLNQGRNQPLHPALGGLPPIAEENPSLFSIVSNPLVAFGVSPSFSEPAAAGGNPGDQGGNSRTTSHEPAKVDSRNTSRDAKSMINPDGQSSQQHPGALAGSFIRTTTASLSFRPTVVHTVRGSERSLSFQIDTTGVKPSEGYNLTFRNLSYRVKNAQNGKMLQLLTNVTGRVASKEMCALMGASGAGKSTLLDILALRKTVGEITGEIYINGKLRTRAMMKSTAYVMQDNAHIPTLTVRETMYFAAQLRLPQETSMLMKEERIQDILKLLGLQHIQYSIVGDEERRGISGGQKKRLSIGVEIVHLPEMIFLDEPTTGLDSAISFEVMYAVRELANQNRTVLCTIHQPSCQTFELFDKVILLGAGQTCYFGKRADIVNYFTESIYRFPNRPGSNPADFVIAIAAQAVLSPIMIHTNGSVSTNLLIEMYRESTLFKNFSDNLEESLIKDSLANPSAETGKESFQLTFGSSAKMTSASQNQVPKSSGIPPQSSLTHHLEIIDNSEIIQDTTTFFQIKVLMHRLLLCKKRDPVTTIIMILRYLVIGIFFGTVFYQLPTGTDPTVYDDRLAVMFFALIALLLNHQEDIPALHDDRLVFYRERATNLYSIFAYWIARVGISLPFDLFNVILFSIPYYWLIGLRESPSNSFPFFFMILWMADALALFTCHFLSFISPTTEIAMSLFPIVLFFATSFEGFIVYLPEFPTWLGWGANLSYMRFSFQALVINELQGNDNLPLAQEYLDMLGFTTFSKTQCACFLIVFLFVQGVVAYSAVRFINFEKR